MARSNYYQLYQCVSALLSNSVSHSNEQGDYVLDVYLSNAGRAFGELYTDNGESLDTISHDLFLYVKFNASMVCDIFNIF